MAKKMNRETLGVRRFYAKNALKAQKRQILVCAGTGCIAGGSLGIYDYLKEECARRGLDVRMGLMHDGQELHIVDGDDVALKKSGRSSSSFSLISSPVRKPSCRSSSSWASLPSIHTTLSGQQRATCSSTQLVMY